MDSKAWEVAWVVEGMDSQAWVVEWVEVEWVEVTAASKVAMAAVTL